MQPGLADATIAVRDSGRGAPYRVHLAGPNCARQFGLLDGVGAAGTAAQSLVVGVAQFVRGREHPADGGVRLLHVPQVTWVLDDNDPSGGHYLDRSGPDEPLREVSDAAGERFRLGCLEQVPVVLQRRAAAGAVHDDRRGAGHRLDDAPGEATRVVDATGVDMERAATRAARTADERRGHRRRA